MESYPGKGIRLSSKARAVGSCGREAVARTEGGGTDDNLQCAMKHEQDVGQLACVDSMPPLGHGHQANSPERVMGQQMSI